MSPAHSLIRYDNPVLISRADGVKSLATKQPIGGGIAAAELKKLPNGIKKLPPVDDKNRAKSPSQTEDILNSILPPRYVIKFRWNMIDIE